MEKETRAMLKRLLETPENFEKEFRRCAVLFSYTVEPVEPHPA
jgi:hypothetical protein